MKTLTILALALLPLSAHAFRYDKQKLELNLDNIKEYNACQDHDYSGEECQVALERWVAAHPNDAFQAGKLTRGKMNAYVAVPFFQKAFDKKKGNCKDEDVKLAVLAGFGLPSDNPTAKASQKIAFEACFNDLKADLIKGLSDGGYFADNACAGLKKKNSVPAEAADKCGK